MLQYIRGQKKYINTNDRFEPLRKGTLCAKRLYVMAFKIFALIKRLMRESKTIMSVCISVLWGLYFKFYKGMQNLYGVLCAFFNAITPMCRSPPRNFDFNSRFLGGFVYVRKKL